MIAFRVSCLVVVLALGCGGKKQPPDAAGKSECEPGRCLDDVARAVQERRTSARACFDAKPSVPAGSLMINFEIGPDGKVIEASKSSKDGQIEDADVTNCVIEVVKTIEFAVSPAGKTTRAYHRFEFN